jgi:hypothetical protein
MVAEAQLHIPLHVKYIQSLGEVSTILESSCD